MPKNLLSIAYDKKSLEMTNHHVLLSHDSRDNKIAHTLKELLSKITLG